MEFLGYAASLLIGLALGLLGGGGSILSIPVLVYLFGIEPVRASAYSLFIVGTVSLFGMLNKYREGLVSLRTGILFGAPSVLSIFMTRKWFVPFLPDQIIQWDSFVLTKRLFILGIFSIVMLAAAVPMIRRNQVEVEADPSGNIVHMVTLGLAIGFVTGLVGAGGGFLIIPALIFLTGLPFKKAAGTSLLIITMNSLMGFVGDVLNYSMEWPFLISITTLALLGVALGSYFSRRLPGNMLRRAFGWFIIITGIFILTREFGITS